MLTDEYLTTVKASLSASQLISSVEIAEEWALPDQGYIRVRAQLVNADFLEAAEYFVVLGDHCVTERYHYQWMDASQSNLLRRWDNVEHYPDLPGFPHHVHLADGRVAPGERLSIQELLVLLASEIPA